MMIPVISYRCSSKMLFKPQFQMKALFTIDSCKNTMILARRYPVHLSKEGTENHKKRFRGRHYVYDLVEDTDIKKRPPVQVLLKSFVEGIGNKGEIVSVPRNVAYHKLILLGLADYVTEEALKKASLEKLSAKSSDSFSSIYAPMTAKYLERQVLGVVMNKDIPWTIEPWHIRVSFRKAGIHVPESCIELPKKKISGPNLDIELKDFYVTVTINKTERTRVRCRIHHWTANPSEKLPFVELPWTLSSAPIFEEDTEILKTLPIPEYYEPKAKASGK